MSPELRLKLYLSGSLDAGAVSLHPVKLEGWYALKTCAKCPSRKRHYSGKKKAWVCAHCGEEWRMRHRFLLKGEVDESLNPDASDGIASRRSTVGLLFNRMLNDPAWTWETRLYAANVLEQSVEEIQREAPEIYGDAWPAWRRRKIFYAIAAGRREWKRRCEAAGL